jgi:hypothetical protein
VSFFITIETFPFEGFGHPSLIGLGVPLVPATVSLTSSYVHGYFGVIKPPRSVR